MLAKTDEATGQPLVDVILDAAEQKGTGRWTAQNALELGVPLTGITEAVFARTLSALKAEREAAADRLAGPSASGDRTAIAGARTSSTRSTRRRSSPTPRASRRWRPPPTPRAGTSTSASMATIWRGGCIIRARFLDRIREAYDAEPDLANLMMAEFFAERAGAGAGSVAARRRSRRGDGDPDAGLLVVAGLLRRLPASARAGQPDPGAARPVRRPHLSSGSTATGRSTSRWGDDGSEVEA